LFFLFSFIIIIIMISIILIVTIRIIYFLYGLTPALFIRYLMS